MSRLVCPLLIVQNIGTCFHYFKKLVTMAEFGVLFLVTYESIRDLMVHKMPLTWIPIPSIFTMTFIPNQDQSCSDEKMVPLSRFEISGPELVEGNEEVTSLYQKYRLGFVL